MRLYNLLMYGALACALALSVALMIIGKAASAQQPLCDDRENMNRILSDRYGESLVAVGITPASQVAPNGLMSIYANDASGTWTITITATNETAPSGFVSCIVGSGQGWRLQSVERFGTGT